MACTVSRLIVLAVFLHMQGFYGVYSEVFKTLAEQEVKAAAERSSNNSSSSSSAAAAAAAGPGFGSSSSNAAEVFGFYNWWSSFTTAKEFTWADLYNPASAPNRQVRAGLWVR